MLVAEIDFGERVTSPTVTVVRGAFLQCLAQRAGNRVRKVIVTSRRMRDLVFAVWRCSSLKRYELSNHPIVIEEIDHLRIDLRKKIDEQLAFGFV